MKKTLSFVVPSLVALTLTFGIACSDDESDDQPAADTDGDADSDTDDDDDGDGEADGDADGGEACTPIPDMGTAGAGGSGGTIYPVITDCASLCETSVGSCQLEGLPPVTSENCEAVCNGYAPVSATCAGIMKELFDCTSQVTSYDNCDLICYPAGGSVLALLNSCASIAAQLAECIPERP